MSLQIVRADIEPTNNTPGGAEPIAVNGTVSGTVVAFDYDYYDLITTQDGNITITCNSTSATYMYAYLIDSNGGSVLGSVTVNSGSGTLSVTAYQLAAGHYYIYVLGNDAANYTLSNTLVSPTINNDTEPNGNSATALVLAQGDTAEGHIGYRYNGGTYDDADYYKITIPVDGDITMNINNDLGGYINFVLIDSDGTAPINNLGGLGQPGFNLTTVALEAGTYYIKVNINLGTEYCGYHLWYSFQPTMYTNDIEPNNTPAQATLINLSNSNTGHLMHRHQGGGYDGADYYKIVLAADGNLILPISNSTGNYIAIAIYDATGSTYINSANGNGQPGFTLTQSLVAGTYIIKVSADLGTHYSGYTFTTGLVGVNEINSITDMQLFPNPAVENLNVKFFNSIAADAVINIVNVNGEICYNKNVFIATGNSEFSLPVKDLADGMYLMQMIVDGNTLERRFVK